MVPIGARSGASGPARHDKEHPGDLYLEDGLHRALRAALQQRQTLHARVLDLNGRHDFR